MNEMQLTEKVDGLAAGLGTVLNEWIESNDNWATNDMTLLGISSFCQQVHSSIRDDKDKMIPIDEFCDKLVNLIKTHQLIQKTAYPDKYLD